MTMTSEERRERIRTAVRNEINGNKVIDSENLALFEEVPDHVQVSKKKNPNIRKNATRDAIVSVALVFVLVAVLVLFVKLLKLLAL